MPVVYSMDTTRMLGGRRIRGIARILCQLYLQLSHSFLKFRVTFFQLSILSLQHSNNGLSHGGKSAICSSVISDDMHEYVPDFAILEKTITGRERLQCFSSRIRVSGSWNRSWMDHDQPVLVRTIIPVDPLTDSEAKVSVQRDGSFVGRVYS